jgi:hypothetical protein
MTLGKPLLVILLVILLPSCVSHSERMKQILAKVPQQDLAYVIGKYAVECEPDGNDCYQSFNSISINYKDSLGNDFPGLLISTRGSMFGSDTTYDFVSPETREKGYYFCHPVPKSSYSVYSFSFYNFANGGSGYSIEKDQQFDIPFSVNKGEVAYIGKLKLSSSSGDNIFGMKIYGPGVLLLSDGADVDITNALKKCPSSVHNAKVKNIALKAALAKGHPLVFDEAANYK